MGSKVLKEKGAGNDHFSFFSVLQVFVQNYFLVNVSSNKI
jgi:hypothetical protein